jgi:phage/plasmid-like protein (TIGR03299 family)
MAHELYEMDGKYSMAFVGDTPWHGLGQNLTKGSSLDVWAKEALLEWTVKSSKPKFDITDFKDLNAEAKTRLTEEGNTITFPGRKVLYRSDTAAPLSIVSEIYKPVQPREILDFFASLIENHDFNMETAGSMKGGQRVWALASTGQGGSIMGQDRIGRYLLLATSCDGSLSTTAQFTTIRVVCNNTLSMAYMSNTSRLKKAEEDKETQGYADIVRIPHNAIFNPDSVKLDLGLSDDFFKQFMDDASNLATIKVDRVTAIEYFMDLIGKTDENGDIDIENVSELTLKRLFNTYKTGVGQDLVSSKGTAWGLVNAVTRFYDHERPSHSQDTRLNSAWLGDGNRMKTKAMGLAVDTFLKAA